MSTETNNSVKIIGWSGDAISLIGIHAAYSVDILGETGLKKLSDLASSAGIAVDSINLMLGLHEDLNDGRRRSDHDASFFTLSTPSTQKRRRIDKLP